MNEQPTNDVTSYRTFFGMYVPCDRETYRKLKRIRHLAGFAEAERRRWYRSQRRQPHNRIFKRRRNGSWVREQVDARRMIFEPFYELKPAGRDAMPADARLAHDRELLRWFDQDYSVARQPVPEPLRVKPLILSTREVDDLLEQLEVWNLTR